MPTLEITLAVQNLAIMQTFYGAVLGVAPSTVLGDRYVGFAVNGQRLGLFRPREVEREDWRSPSGAWSLCLYVPDLVQACRTVIAAGGAIASEAIAEDYGHEVYVQDPEGNRLILCQGQPPNASQPPQPA